MLLTPEEQAMLNGNFGQATRKAMLILEALGTIYGAENMVPVSSVQISGVSYDNLGDAGLAFLDEMAIHNGRVRVMTTLNPAGMDIENWQAMGIVADFALNQEKVIDAFKRMGVIPTCSCTPYLFGNLPHFGEHIAWAESSAVCFANAVLGACTNREGGPSALAAALTGRTPRYGYHLAENRHPTITVQLQAPLSGTSDFGAFGAALGRLIENRKQKDIPLITGLENATLEELKSLCAAIATYGGLALFHIRGITPEAGMYDLPAERVMIGSKEIDETVRFLNQSDGDRASDFFSLGCPHLSLNEIKRIAGLLAGKKVKKTFWITTSRPVKKIADEMGYSKTIEEAGAVFAVDTCCVVAPIKGRFRQLTTDSAKACYYGASKNGLKTRFLPFDEVVLEALR